MERKHFDDLTKIDVQLGRLDDDTYARLLTHDGPIEFRSNATEFENVADPAWLVDLIYRVTPQPLTKPQVPWEHMADWVQYVARDKNGTLWAYDALIFPERGKWFFEEDGDKAKILSAFKIDPGTCDWRDSLVKRPEEV